ncbi:Vegetative incompatibility protein HET-E-1 [Lachnellula suecica]|uniref:Vegetative incompatibility protein HET-E-1 n=1 Tax=Lachnellula suecica TaxID=602035 RepID=A0A8T9C6J4_9HELO|nr:Vegetative incompatibility protein HET-E-1 [Lachnellula suecica]
MPDNISIRSFRRKESDLSSIDDPPTRSSSFAYGSSLFSKATIIRDDGVDDSKGPLGFNLLHCPSEAFIDFIFVHGLGGGSRKTWSKTSSLTHFWPQEWLPKDPAFKCVRVHSFGYDSDWAKGKGGCQNVHHFGKSLLGELSTSPHVGHSTTPIVLIGHSMGGLVIKKAYMLARQDPTYETLAAKFHTICFLATPHRGSDSAKLLSDILQAAYSSRAYVEDLKRSSGAIQIINDEFRNYSARLKLWSFYETQKLNMGGPFSTLIVAPESATLGYPDEKQMPMNADHRSICKFDTIKDPNYLVIRNALAAIVSNISTSSLESTDDLQRSQLKCLSKYLGVSGIPEDDLASAEDARIPGTCKWFQAKNAYVKWQDFTVDTPSVLWVKGKPAAGKSILAGSVIRQLQTVNTNCSYFFFKHGDKAKSRLSACLRSLAFQMACTHLQIREKLLEMQKDEIIIDKDNERTIWRTLFVSGIFTVPFSAHYWVIDGLDECLAFSSFLDTMLAKLDISLPLRHLITSRESSEFDKSFVSLGTDRVQSEKIETEDTLPDIRLLVEIKARSLIVMDDDDRAILIKKILEKSRGSFLWTVLVLNELSSSHSAEEINQVLDDVPRDMEPLYQRTLGLMSQAGRGKKLANAILTWVACARKPLNTDELDGALKLDIKDEFLNLEKSIVALCGQLVTVDRFGKVQMIHETAREYLLKEDLDSEFAINKREAHTRIARACLIYLTGPEMRPPRSGRRTIDPVKKTSFSMYACEAFSYHLSKSDPFSNEILVLVDKFLRSNVLSWIELVAQTQDLILLIRAANDLRTYLKISSAELNPLGKELRIIRSWTTDMIRIAAKFSDALILSPSAIFSLVLPFCPTGSAAYRTANTGKRLSVLGLSNSQWDDRLACIDFRQGQASALCVGDDFVAVGLTTGTVSLYHGTSCQEYKTLHHGEAVRLLKFRSKSSFMASCGLKTIRIWDIRNGETVYTFEAPPRPIFLEFDQNFLIAASYKNYLTSWDLGNEGARQPDRIWNDSGEYRQTPLRRPPSAISISLSHKMMAIAYSGQSITLWDLEGDAYYGTCGKKLPSGETSTHVVSALVFNPNINTGLLAVSYLDGELVLVDPFSDQELESVHANCHTLAASPDGRLLAGGAGFGTIHIYGFDTLKLLYRVKSSNLYIKQLAFSKDTLHFADIRGSQCNIWEPALLLRDLVGDDSSEGSSTSVLEAVVPDAKAKISAMVLNSKGDVVFCGKEDGSVCAYDLKTGAHLRTLYSHKSQIRILAWSTVSNTLISIDSSNGIHARSIRKTQSEGCLADQVLFQSRLDSGKSITQVLLGEAAGKLVLSTRESDHFWNINGHEEKVQTYSKTPGIRKWTHYPQSPLHMICIEATVVRLYAWSDWSETSVISLNMDTERLQLKSASAHILSGRLQILIEQSELDGSASTSGLHLFDATALSIGNDSAKETIQDEKKREGTKGGLENSTLEVAPSSRILSPQFASLARLVAHVIGLDGNGKLVFLDSQSWVCSADLENFGVSPSLYMRHFFVPYDWFSGTRIIISAHTKRDVLFARNEDVAIIKGGLDHVEKIHTQ